MFESFKSFIAELPAGKKIAVATSGGADSMALMHLCAAAGLPVVALTIDHGLRPESAAEAKMVARAATKIGAAHHTLHWVGDKPTTGIEESARAARYDLMLNFCRENGIEVLMTAHHADDNIETFLMNLGRGSGLYGLGGLRARQMRGNVMIARPLLGIKKQVLRDWCIQNEIPFVDDPMNEDEKFLRVKIRKNRHILNDRLGITDKRILLAISSLARARHAAEQNVDSLISDCATGTGAEILADLFFDLPDESQLKFLSAALQRVGGAEYPPRLDSVRRVLASLGANKTITLSHCKVRMKKGMIFITKENQDEKKQICE